MPEPEENERFVTNVLVIGSGAAGLRASIHLAEQGLQTLVVAKRRREDAHTVWAAGGINAVKATTDPEDTWQQHAADTLGDGYWLNDPGMVETLVRRAPEALDDLIGYGAQFRRDESGELVQRFFGAHTYKRTCYAGDHTGREIQNTLVRRASSLRIDFNDQVCVTSLLVRDGRVFGAYGFDVVDGHRCVFLADAVILAAGGHTRVFRRSSARRDENNGDSMRLASEAGARLRDMELVQFHPSGMVAPEEYAGELVSEAIRGEGGLLTNSEGRRFMEDYDAERMELSSRDRVALANYTEIAQGRGTERGGVRLDVSHMDREQVMEKFPSIYRKMIDLAMLDITHEPMEVAPTAHYSMGGIYVDRETQETDIEGLFAVGECSSGLHGANRLGGNSLAECVVFGRIGAESAARFADSITSQIRDPQAIERAGEDVDEMLSRRGEEFPRSIQRALRDTMWEHASVIRSADGLEEGERKLDEIERRGREVEIRPDIAGFDDLVHAYDLRSMLLASRATVAGAVERRETRGAHNRSDFPDEDPAFKVSLLYTPEGEIERADIPETSAEVLALARGGELETAGRLTE